MTLSSHDENLRLPRPELLFEVGLALLPKVILRLKRRSRSFADSRRVGLFQRSHLLQKPALRTSSQSSFSRCRFRYLSFLKGSPCNVKSLLPLAPKLTVFPRTLTSNFLSGFEEGCTRHSRAERRRGFIY